MYEKDGGPENCMAKIFVEGYAFGAKGRGVFGVAELGGILRVMLAERFKSFYEVPPTSLKKFITSKGNVNKSVVLEKVFRKYGIGSEQLQDDNQVDAYGLARFGIVWYQKHIEGKEDFPGYELDAVKAAVHCTLDDLEAVIK
jgi:crossover junction endodeoxyribonuclease RuvC